MLPFLIDCNVLLLGCCKLFSCCIIFIFFILDSLVLLFIARKALCYAFAPNFCRLATCLLAIFLLVCNIINTNNIGIFVVIIKSLTESLITCQPSCAVKPPSWQRQVSHQDSSSSFLYRFS